MARFCRRVRRRRRQIVTTRADDADGAGFIRVDAIYAARAAGREGRDPWVHPMCQPLPTNRGGPFLPLADGSLLTVDAAGLSVSHDDGATWAKTIPAAHGQGEAASSCAVLEPAPGTLVMVYLDSASELAKFTWNNQSGEPESDCYLELRSIRSLDGGRTWCDRQRLLDGYNADFFGFIRTCTGRLVLVAEHLVTNPGRWVVCSFVSDDNGKSWRRSNLIDLGGRGHHDGALEPTVAELSDGRLLMLIRTNLGFFWQALSDDGGTYWRTIGPSRIDASASPGRLVRVGSGRLILVWNRRDPEDGPWPPGKPEEQTSEFPASLHREELSIAASDDDALTWSPPIVIARLRGGQVSYPHVLERRDGELWIIAGIAARRWFSEDPVHVGVKILETDFLRGSVGQVRGQSIGHATL